MSAGERKKPEHVTSPAHIATAKSAASQRRHELVNNTLVNQFHKIVEAFKGGPSRRTWIVLGLVGVAVGLWFIWRYYDTKSKEKLSGGWSRELKVMFADPRMPQALDEKSLPVSPEEEQAKIAKDFEGTTLARVAQLNVARSNLDKGQRLLGSADRAQGLKLVREAKDLYQKLQSESTDDPELHLESILNTGKGYEMLGEWSKALEQYRLLITVHEKGDAKNAFYDEAKAGEERLKEGSASRKEQEELNNVLNRKSGL